jgi:formate dehydrogenase subunit gamma
VPLIADAFNLSRAEVHGVVSFYHHFREQPAGRHTLQLCRAEACQAMNGDALAEFARKRLQIDFGETRKDGKATLESVYCLGNCACAPSAMIDGELRGRLDRDALAKCAQEWGVPE